MVGGGKSAAVPTMELRTDSRAACHCGVFGRGVVGSGVVLVVGARERRELDGGLNAGAGEFEGRV